MNVEIVKLGRLETNCYILDYNGEILVIDPGDDFYILKRYLMERKVIGVLVTHNHPDHIGALSSLVDAFKVPVYDKNNLQEGRFEIGPFHFDVIYTPGHTSDSVTYYFRDYNFMFSGDFLFKGSIGRTDLEYADVNEMKKSIEKIKKYNDDIIIYPGHGDSSNLKFEKEYNMFFGGMIC